jgi:hypothetical protein|tara:strand:+ start:3933 stop:4964 length:1032 start_codon:yes stop_codon:yes gene_type:complete
MNKINAVMLAGLSSIVLPALAATPQISAIEGELDQGSEIIILGRDFGSPNFSFIFRDDANENLLIERLTSLSSITQGDAWVRQGSAWAEPLTQYTGKDLARGSDSNVYRGTGKAYLGWPEALNGRSNETLFISWWFNPLMDPGANGGSNKFLRVWDHPNGEHTRMAWDQMHIVYWRKDVDSSGFIEWGGWSGNVGSWNKIDAWMDSNTNKMIIHVNGREVIDVDDFRKSNVSEGLDVALIGFDPSIGDNYRNMVFGIDDVYISNSRARIEVSNSETWKEGITSEIITPISWSDNEISFKLDLAVVDKSSPLYFYVINSSGEVNSRGFAKSSRAPSKIEELVIE